MLTMSDKLKPTFTGQYPIIKVHTNGTVTIRLHDNLMEQINIRCIKPYHTLFVSWKGRVSYTPSFSLDYLSLYYLSLFTS